MTTPCPTKPKRTALAVWSVYGFTRLSVVCGAGTTPRDPRRHPFYVVRGGR